MAIATQAQAMNGPDPQQQNGSGDNENEGSGAVIADASNLESVKQIMKNFPLQILSSSVKERQAIFMDVHKYILLNKSFSKEAQETIVKRISKLLPLTLFRYHDRDSRRVVIKFLEQFIARYPEMGPKNLISSLNNFSQENFKCTNSNKTIASIALEALEWSCMLMSQPLSPSMKLDDDSIKELIRLQSILLTCVILSGDQKLTEKSYRKLSRFWTDIGESIKPYCQNLISLSSEDSSLDLTTTLQFIALWGFLIRHSIDTKSSESRAMISENSTKDVYLNLFTKHILPTKQRLPLYVNQMGAAIKPYLKQVTAEEFKSSLLPSMQKAVLRSPENVMDMIAIIIDCLPFDLSPYSLDLGKMLGTSLHSQAEDIRSAAVAASKNLSKQCSDASALEQLIKHYFGVLNGSEGKITNVEQRYGVLNGIGALSNHSLSSGQAQQITEKIIGNFIAFLKQEVHEGTLVLAANHLTTWCAFLTEEVPQNLVDFFKTSYNSKISTPAVRAAYITCMSVAFKSDGFLEKAHELTQILNPPIQKSFTTAPTLIPILSEGINAAVLLARICAQDGSQADIKSNKTSLQGLLEPEKLNFLNEKFIYSSPDSPLISLIELLQVILINFETRLNQKKIKLFTRTLMLLHCHPSHLVRKKASNSLRKIMGYTTAVDLPVAATQEFINLFRDDRLIVHPDQQEQDDAEATNGKKAPKNSDDLKFIKPPPLVECLTNIAVCGKVDDPLSNSNTKLLLEMLTACHLPIVHATHSHLWVKLASSLVKPMTLTDYLTEKRQEIIDYVLAAASKNYDDNHVQINMMRELTATNAHLFLESFLDYSLPILEEPDLRGISKEEYEIFLTPEGQMHDPSILDLYREVEEKNARKEKGYSIKDIRAEKEIKKEMDAKKKAQNESQEPKLSKKQQEIKTQTLAKESALRKRLQIVEKKAVNALALLGAIVDGNPQAASLHIRDIVPPLLTLFKSHLCAPKATKFFVELRHCAFIFEPSDLANFSELMAHTTVRRFDPTCEIEERWCKFDVDQMSKNLVERLYKRVYRPTGEDYDEKAAQKAIQERLTSPAFSYCFFLLRSMLNKKYGEKFLSKVLHVVSEHAQTRRPSDLTESEAFSALAARDPEYLPRAEMMFSLLDVVSTFPTEIKLLAGEVLVEVARASSGDEGCAIATDEEITILCKNGLRNKSDEAKLASLEALDVLAPYVIRDLEDDLELKKLLTQRMFVVRFDPNEKCAEKSQNVWTNCGLRLMDTLCFTLIDDLKEGRSYERTAISDGYQELMTKYPLKVKLVIDKLMEMYHEKNKLPPPPVDQFGRPTGEKPVDAFHPRVSVGAVLQKIAQFIPSDYHIIVVEFLITEAFKDRNAEVRTQMLEAGIALVECHGKSNLNLFLETFQNYLENVPATGSEDNVRRCVVIMLGNVAKHLKPGDPRIMSIVGHLIESLSTPAQMVQEAVANCLHPLVPLFKDEVSPLMKNLLELLLESESYAERRGAAYGIASLSKGLGITSLKAHGIMDKVMKALKSEEPNHREGALMLIEMLCIMLGKLFEPYVTQLIPYLLLALGDSVGKVRVAAEDASKTIMSRLSIHGVRLVLPSLLEGIDQDNWRTKAASVEMVGAMAHCAPQQLSTCLPSIVPRLMNVVNDSHPKVSKSGSKALKRIGSVIKNPEVQKLVPSLVAALEDPSSKASKCLTQIYNTKFVHFIDAPSLALIMPVIERAFQERSTETRKKAAQIIGNMYSLTNQKDLAPYLSSITPGLKQSLLDPVPEVRSVTAKAFGAMVKGMGESAFNELLPWLMTTLVSKNSSVDRSGAAQGLSEILGGLGVSKLDQFMSDIIKTTEKGEIKPWVRDGYTMLFIYLPMVFNKEFTHFIGRIISPILRALADETEYVRETGLRAGQRVVNMYADTAIQLLLPELEDGLFNENWRIRFASVQLLGDLLFKISGTSGKMSSETTSEDDTLGTEHGEKAIVSSLGAERRNTVLSGLYMCRNDVVLVVRQAALHVWKVVVPNTPRTLKEILPTLFSLLLGCLASSSFDKQQVAARTLGDIVKKMGERVLPEIIPILERGMSSPKADQRQGVCIGLSEILASTSKEMVLAFVDSLVPTVRRALHDPLPEVRQAAAKTFDSLHSAAGSRALDEILPYLMNKLTDPHVGEYCLDGLRQVMAIKSRVVLPYLVPQLTQPPINTKALAFLGSVAGDALSKHLNKILPALLISLSKSMGTPEEKQEYERCLAVVLSVSDELGTRTLVETLLELARSHKPVTRKAAVLLLDGYCNQSKADLEPLIPQLVRGLILLYTDNDESVLQMSSEALLAITKNLETREQIELVPDVRNAVRFAVSDMKSTSSPLHYGAKQGKLLPGFCQPKGITPLLPIFREGILSGSPEQKENAAHGLSEVIALTSPEALKPSVINIAGPLIRILGDRFPWNVKVAVLDTLSLLLAKSGINLRPFVPQLQQTFLKALTDPHRGVRLRAANALSYLIVIHTRCDPIFNEIHNSIKTTSTDDSGLKETMIHALRSVITPAGDRIPDPLRKSITATLVSHLGASDDGIRQAAAACLGSLSKWLPNDELSSVAREHLIDDDSSLDWTLRHGRCVALRICLKDAAQKLLTLNDSWPEKIAKALQAYITSDRVQIVQSGIKGATYYFQYVLVSTSSQSLPAPLLSAFARCLNHSNNDIKLTVAMSATYLAKTLPGDVGHLPAELLKPLAPLLVNGTKEKNTMVRAASEQALVAVLKLRESGSESVEDSPVVQDLNSKLEPGARNSLAECIQKVLKRVASQAEPRGSGSESLEDQFDDTLLT